MTTALGTTCVRVVGARARGRVRGGQAHVARERVTQHPGAVYERTWSAGGG